MDREAIQERFGIIGTSPGIRKVVDRIRLVAPTDISVLITGESGVGKELVAHALHELSPRRHRPMVTVNAGAIPEGLIESELFGAEKGSYTGAVSRRTGVFEDADGSSIFLDEIGEMPANAQVRLLRVLESGEFSRIGSSALIHTDVRVIGATNKDLGREVQTGRFREDLYYRISTVEIRIPPLRERRDDILLLFNHFQHRFAQQYGARMKTLTGDARDLLLRYHWPGNVRELRNTAEQTVVLLRDQTVSGEQIRPFMRGVTVNGTPGLVLASERRRSSVPEGEFDQGLIYRMMLELHQDMRELKRMVQSGARPGPPPDAVEERNLPAVREPVVPVMDEDWFIEDAPYEIESEEPEDVTDVDIEDAPLPTIAEAERRLIAEALRRFEGNRRRTAEALDISERTLYRKIKEMELEGDLS